MSKKDKREMEDDERMEEWDVPEKRMRTKIRAKMTVEADMQ